MRGRADTATMRRATRALTGTLACGALVLPAAAAGKTRPVQRVAFSPARVLVGGRVKVSAPARPHRSLSIYLAEHRRAARHDVSLGTIRATSGTAARGWLTVPRSTAPGRYYVLACRSPHAGCTSSEDRLVVLPLPHPPITTPGGGGGGGGAGGGGTGSGGTGPGTPTPTPTPPGDYKYTLKYTHVNSSSWSKNESSSFFIGTENYHEDLELSSDIETDGDPYTGTSSGSAPINYDQAAYHDEQNGSWQSQAGYAGTSGACNGDDTTDLTGTTPGTATVVGLHITTNQITLQFRPGATPAGPGETLTYADTLTNCPPGNGTLSSDLFLNRFQNYYDLLQDPNVKVVGTGTGNGYVQYTGGWQLGDPSQPNVVATLTVTGQWDPNDPNSTYTDHFEIDRKTDQG